MVVSDRFLLPSSISAQRSATTVHLPSPGWWKTARPQVTTATTRAAFRVTACASLFTGSTTAPGPSPVVAQRSCFTCISSMHPPSLRSTCSLRVLNLSVDKQCPALVMGNMRRSIFSWKIDVEQPRYERSHFLRQFGQNQKKNVSPKGTHGKWTWNGSFMKDANDYKNNEWVVLACLNNLWATGDTENYLWEGDLILGFCH